MLTEKTDYIKFFYTRRLGVDESKSKPKLVFLHGLLGNGQNWIPSARALEDRFEILLIDQRGHGKTGKLEGDYAPKDFSADLLLVADALGWQKFSLIGHSLGARNAFDFASKNPERIEKLVIEDMGPHKTREASKKTEVMIEAVPVPFKSRTEARTFFQNEFEELYGKLLSDYLYSNIEKKEDGSYGWRFYKEGALEALKIGRESDFWTEFEKIQSETLIIRGERSEHLPKDVFQEMLKRNTNTRGVEISGAGHWVHFDQFSTFVKQVDEFLSKQDK
jgi:pimeloyl-ACP methyl ester carboxylesterase